jgi:riboflavin kinase/FMN adenylyltransferase
MEVLTDLCGLRKKRLPIFLAAGFFDGVHRGHVRVIRRTIERAARHGGRAWVLTFDTHPLKVLKPGAAPRLLTSNPHKLRLLKTLSLDGCLVLPFTRQLAALPPEDFVRWLRHCAPSVVEVLVGSNWRFGRGGAGTPSVLSRLGRDAGLAVTVVSPVLRKGKPISSTRVRTEITRGDLVEARVLLGRPFSVLGTVTRGRTIGRRLGYPTANLDPHGEVLPPQGVYAVRAAPARKVFDGVLNLGQRPTFGIREASGPHLELHLLDLRRELYGRDIEVFFVRRLRDEKTFASPGELSRQIAADITRSRRILARTRTKTRARAPRKH